MLSREVVEGVFSNLRLERDMNGILVAQNRRAQFGIVSPAAVQVHADDWEVQFQSRLDFPANKFEKMACAFANQHNRLSRIG